MVGQRGGRMVGQSGTVGKENSGPWCDSGEGGHWDMLGHWGLEKGGWWGVGEQWRGNTGIRGKVGGTHCEHFKMRFFNAPSVFKNC